MHLGPVGAFNVVDQLMQIVGESILGVGALVQLGEHVALPCENCGSCTAKPQLDVILPLHLVADVVLIPRIRRIGDG